MLKALEKRLGKLEKAEQAKTGSTVIDEEERIRREEFSRLWRTPEGRKLVRKRATESAERILSAMRTRKRAQIEKMASPEQLERYKKQWVEEDAKDEARRKELAEWRERMEAEG